MMCKALLLRVKSYAVTELDNTIDNSDKMSVGLDHLNNSYLQTPVGQIVQPKLCTSIIATGMRWTV